MREYDIGGKIKRLRKARKLTLQDVAAETGFSTALLSQLENNNVSPPIATLSRIASFFEVRIGDFFEEGDDDLRFEVLRREERTVVPKVVSRDGSSHGYFYEALSGRKRNRRMDPFLLTLNSRVETTETYSHGGEEFLFVVKGRAELILDDRSLTLEEGDSVYFESSLKHRLLARECDEVKVLAVVMR